MLVKFEDPIIEEVVACSTYKTPIGDVKSLPEAQKVKSMLLLLKKWPDLRSVLLLDRNKVVIPTILAIVKEWLDFLSDEEVTIWTMRLLSNLSCIEDYHYFMDESADWVKAKEVVCYKTVDSNFLFDTKQDAINHHIHVKAAFGKYVIVQESGG